MIKHRTLIASIALVSLAGCREQRASSAGPGAPATASSTAGRSVPATPSASVPAAGSSVPGPASAPGVPSATSAPLPVGTPAGTASASGATPLQVPGTAAGTLSASDRSQPDGAVADEFALTLTAGVPVTIVVRGGLSSDEGGGNIDVFAILLLEGHRVADDDDHAGNNNARIVFTPTTSGTYILRVTTFGGGLHQGAYTVQTWAGADDDAT